MSGACPSADTLAALFDGDVPAGERAALADHAAGCEECRAVLALAVEAAPPSPDAEEAVPADAEVLVPGDTVGRFVIEKRLGAGGMGVVYAAVDTELHRRVAVKLLRADRDAIGSQGKERLLREARVLAKLSHPNVVTVFDVGMRGDQLYIAMELVDGGNLGTWLRRTPRSPREIVERMREAGAGLAAAHAAGVIHRDVKPDNILVGHDGRARVTDFGLARSVGLTGSIPRALAPGTYVPDTALTRTHAVVGTPIYMAPEQLGGASADERSDQWSFCATLYEAIAGARPFAPSDIDARRRAIATGDLAVPSGGRRVPGWIKRVAQRGLRAEPSERWPSMAALVNALDGRRPRRRMIAGIAALVLLVAASVAVAVVAMRRPPAKDPFEGYLGQDPRTTCNCPFAACDEGVCLGACGEVEKFTLGAPVPGVSLPARQEALLGASSDGDAILYASMPPDRVPEEGYPPCDLDRLMLARRSGDRYVERDITDSVEAILGSTKRRNMEGGATLARDGRSIIVRTPDMKRFVRVHLGPNDQAIVADFTEFADITPPLLGKYEFVVAPVISADEKTLYFLLAASDERGDFTPLRGAWHSHRTDPRQPFPRGDHIPGLARNFDLVSGVTDDGLTLFMSDEFATRVLMRSTPEEMWRPPYTGAVAPMLYGWRDRPIQGCRVLATQTPGGCAAEDIVFLEPKRRPVVPPPPPPP